jgi:aspartate kinase
MTLIVQKYGGTSLATVERVRKVAEHVADYHRRGHDLVVVVSAMGKETNRLKSLAFEISEQPSPRELDVLLTAGERVSMSLLSIGLNELKVPCVSFTGSQSGIITDTEHGNARIQNILGDRIQAALDGGKVAIVAGFQGMALPTKDITTLGRGGSDLTAVALAHRLQAKSCEIYTDVDGVYNSDPRHNKNARQLKNLTHRELCNLAWSGAGVVHARAAQLASKFRIPLNIRSSFNLDRDGTIIHTSDKKGKPMEKAEVVAITSLEGLSMATLVVDSKHSIANLYQTVNSFFWSKDSTPIIHNYISEDSSTSVQLSFDLRKADAFIEMMKSKFDADVKSKDSVTCINIVGQGFLQDHELVCEVLAKAGEDVLAFHKSNELLKLIVTDDKSAKIMKRLQESFLGTRQT